MNKNLIETVMGAVVLLVAVGFLAFAYKSGKVQTGNGYHLIAKFDRVDGLTNGADVRVSGIKVGSVADQQIDPKTYQAIVTVSVDNAVKIPTDSTAEIVGDGLLGSKYLAIVPGAEDNMLTENGEIKFTQSSVSLEQLIGKLMFSGGDSKKKDSTAATAPQQTPPNPPGNATP